MGFFFFSCCSILFSDSFYELSEWSAKIIHVMFAFLICPFTVCFFPSSWKIDCLSLYYTLLFTAGLFVSHWQLHVHLLIQWVHLDLYPILVILFRKSIVYVYCKTNIFLFFNLLNIFCKFLQGFWQHIGVILRPLIIVIRPQHNNSEQYCLCGLSVGVLYFLVNLEL